jgi:hypothetical protein
MRRLRVSSGQLWLGGEGSVSQQLCVTVVSLAAPTNAAAHAAHGMIPATALCAD